MTTPQLTPDHYRDAVAILRATLLGDQDGLTSVLTACDPAMTVQALVRLHLSTVVVSAGSVEIADQFLADYLKMISTMEDKQ